MATRVAITGFGRIGRLVLRSLLETKRDDIEVVALNVSGDIKTAAHLFKYDSIHGTYHGELTTTASTIGFGKKQIPVFTERDPHKLPWKDLDIDVVIECTGAFNSKEASSAHLESGAKKVLISAPAKNADMTVVYGVNEQNLNANHKIVSNASCTTNALAPLVSVLHNQFSIEQGFMTTIHAYTGDQRLVDNRHKDLRRARAAGQSMIPTSTGAAKSISLIIPELAGKLDGTAIRVPTANVSLINLTMTLTKNTTVDEVNNVMRNSSETHLNGILGICDEPLVSCDFNHSPYSSVFDTTQTKLINGNLLHITAWYDNEWGFSLRMADTAALIGKLS